MIIFIAPNPNKVKEREGFLQRVAAIDDIFSREQKIYYEDIDDLSDLAEKITQADMVYVHSLYFAEKILLLFPILKDRVVVDLHGVVPEEEKFAGNKDRSEVLSRAEEVVFRHGKYFVAVSQAMVDHFTHKYKLSKRVKWVILPIFNVSIPPDIKNKKITKNVIYAGGAQKWQNVDLMVDAINKVRDYSYTILTHSPDAFSEISGDIGIKVTIKTVKSDQVHSYYIKASLGFVLRDDIVVNRVACPTKLIEYLSEGVVPIVLSPNIGDFSTLGYKYFTVKDFIDGKADKASIKKAIESNFAVFEKLVAQTKTGTRDLTVLYSEIVTHPHKQVEETIKEYIKSTILTQIYEDTIEKYKQQIDHQTKVINEYAKSVDYYKGLLNSITHSKKWIAINKISQLKAAIGRHK